MNLPQGILVVATADWDSPFWTNKQHIAARLARRGFRVLFIESLGLRRPHTTGRDCGRMARRLLRGFRGPRHVREGLWVDSPLVVPAHRSALVRRLNQRLLLGRLRRSIRRLGLQSPIIWTYNPVIVETLLKLPHSMLIYHCVDDLAAAPDMPSEVLRETEAALLASADIVFAVSRALQAQCAQHAPARTHYSPNVADFEHFSAARQAGPIPSDLEAILRPRIGFIGAISEYKVDFDLIAAVADARPDWHWVLIGQLGEGQPGTSAAKLRRPNIHLLGPRPYDTLPGYLRGFDVAVLPCPRNAYTRAMSPMKFFEYLAAGRPIVATPVDGIMEYRETFWAAETPDAFRAAIERALAGDVPDPATGLRFARENTWERRLDSMLKVIESRWREKADRS